MRTLNDYRMAVNERESFDFNSVGYKAANEKLEQIIEKGLEEGNRLIALEVQDDINALLESGMTLDDELITNWMELLEENGFEDIVEEIIED